MKLIFLFLLVGVIKVKGSNLNSRNVSNNESANDHSRIYLAYIPGGNIVVQRVGSATNPTFGTSYVNLPPGYPRYGPGTPVAYNMPPRNSPYPSVASVTLGTVSSPFPNYSLSTQPGPIIRSSSQSVPRPPIMTLPISSPAQQARGYNHDELNKYVSQEVNSYHFKVPIRHDLMRMLIEWIAKNDYASYKANENNFKSVFGAYEMIKKGKERICYLPHYIIYFGATNFIELIRTEPKSGFEKMKLEKAFQNLINTKPLNTVVTIFKACLWLREEDQKKIATLFKSKYPNLHHFDYLYFEFPIIFTMQTDDSLKILNASTIEEKLAHLKAFLVYHQNSFYFGDLKNFAYKRLLVIPTAYPELFQSLPDWTKLTLGKIAVINDDLDALLAMIKLDLNILLMNLNDSNTIFEFVVECNKQKIVPLMISLVPELAIAPKRDGKDSIYKSLIVEDNLEMIKCFEQNGFSSEAKVIEGKNAIQLAFELGVPKLIAHFIESFGRDKVMEYLMEVYESEEKIIGYATNKFDALLIEFLRAKLII